MVIVMPKYKATQSNNDDYSIDVTRVITTYTSTGIILQM